MRNFLIFLLAASVLFVAGCQKELSIEGSSSPAQGSLQSDVTGDCLPKTVRGTYVAARPLVADSNTITVQVDVSQTGTFVVTTDTVNGYYFRATGIFTATGLTNVTLRGYGTPFAQGTNNFRVSFDSTFCDIQVDVLPVGTGGPATFTLVNGGTPPNCASAVVNGAYVNGTALSASNTVDISVNVTQVGTYTITATGGGMTFTKTGTFTTTGVQTVTLTGTGTPTTTGANTVTFAAPFAGCSFTVTVSGPAVGTLGGSPGACTPATVNGVYAQGTALTASNTVQIQVSITTAGAYNISTNTVAGITFSGSAANINVGPNQLITLTGTGTPTASGTQTFTVTFGTSSCTFTVNILSSDYFPRTNNSNWSYEIDDVANDSLLRWVNTATLTALSNTWNIFMFNDGTGPDSSGYYRKNGGDYYEYFDVGTFIGYDNPLWVEYIMLKDNVAQGTSWNSAAFPGTVTVPPAPPQSLTIRFKYTIDQKDVPVSITTSTGTVNYTNVIVVKEEYEQQVGAAWVSLTTTVGYGKSYYARGIGLIKYEAFDGTGVLQGQQELRRSVVF